MASTRKSTRLKRTHKKLKHAAQRSRKNRAQQRKLERNGALTIR